MSSEQDVMLHERDSVVGEHMSPFSGGFQSQFDGERQFLGQLTP